MILVLLRVDTQALRNKVDFHSVDMLYQTSNRGHQLLHNVPVNIGLKSAAAHNLVEAKC